MAKNFSWKPDGPLPHIEEHSLRKLDVLKNYLDDYFDTVVQNPATDTLNITLVDGFCGGGGYSRDDGTVYGSPIILLQAVQEAERRLNEGREKPLKINAKYFFVDDKQDHIDTLRQQLELAGYNDLIGRSVNIICGKFSDNLQGIIRSIRSGQRAGRSIFLLDQCGYSDVPMAAIKQIFSSLNRPEVILTFGIDSLLNYLHEESASQELYRQFGVDHGFIAEWHANKNDEALGRLVAQRALMGRIQMYSGAEFFTPFLLWSRTDNRWMMLAHLSRHQAARDKMLGVHWNVQNSFAHIGKGSLFALGFDTRLIESKDSLFNFTDIDRQKLSGELLNELPSEIFDAMSDDQITVQRMLERIGNRTAATNEDLFAAILELARGKEIEVISPSGSRKRVGTRITVKDRLVRPRQQTLFNLGS